MSFKFELYFLDCETTGLEYNLNEIIELSIYRLSDNQQRTWCLKPSNYDSIQEDALRVNQHKIQDLKWQTEYGKQTYLEPAKVIVDIENWFMQDNKSPDDRILVGQNPNFDLRFLQTLWNKHEAKDTFPFGNRPFTIDTREIALFLDLVEGTRSEYYNLGSLIKKYGIKNSKAHTAAADTLATKELFIAQLEKVRKAFNS